MSELKEFQTPRIDVDATSATDSDVEGSPVLLEQVVLRPVAGTEVGSLGRLFLNARLKRGLTISDVAQVIKFSPRQIEAIESDDFEKLPGATFMRGFIRSYAKFLQLDPAPMLVIFDRQVPQVVVQVQEPRPMGVALPQFIEHKNRSLYMSVLGALLLVFVVAIAYVKWSGAPVQVKSADSAGAETIKPPPVTVLPPPLPARVEPAAVASQNVQSAFEAQVPKPLPPDNRQLILSFEGRSWVEVKDATQHVLVAQNNEPGTRQVVSGKPPFAVVIGNASQVQLLYEDRQIDLLPYTRVDVARLTLE